MRRRVLLLLAGLAVLGGCPPADDLGTGRDALAVIADGGPATDAGPEDAGSVRSCAPRPSGASIAALVPPRPKRATACDDATRRDLALCFMEQKPSTCLARLETKPEACRQCLVSASSDPEWGPLVRYESGEVLPNEAGCWAVAAPESATCAPAIHRRAECQMLGVCGGCTAPLPHELKSCFDRAIAEGGACATLRAEEQACTFPVAEDGGMGAFTRCIRTHAVMPAAYWLGLFDLFCGS